MKNEIIEISEYLQELKYLVDIDSVSSEPAGSGKIAAYIKEKFSAIGMQVKEHNFNAGIGPCLEISNRPTDKFDVLLLAHMDTVFPLGTAANRPFKIEAGRAYGPGVIDCKAGLLSSFYVVRQLLEAGTLAGKSIGLFFNSDHEGISSRYSHSCSQELAKKSRYVLVLEAGRANGSLVNKRKGIGRYHITINGKAAHAGVDHASGINAIEEMAHWVLALQKMTDYGTETTLNIGKIEGGTAISAVPAECRAALDVRFYDMAKLKEVENMMERLVAEPMVKGTRAVVEGGVTRPPMLPNERTEKLCRVIDELGQNLGIKFGWMASGGGSDGSFAAAVGTPTIDALGPVGGGAHSEAEYLDIASVVPRSQLLLKTIEYILQHDE